MTKLEKHQAFRSKRRGNGEAILVKGGARGRNMYLWVQGDPALFDRIAIVPGRATLKRLALAILRECRRTK